MKAEPQSISILGISGSLRLGSYSTALLQALRAQRFSGDMDMVVRTLGDIPLYDEDLEQQAMPSGVNDLRRAVAECDGVLIVTPEYNHGVPGILKNALDWVSRPAFASPFRGKPVLIASCATAFTGGVRAQYQLRETLVSMLAEIVPTREIVVGSVHTKVTDGRLTNQESIEHLSKGLDGLLSSIRARQVSAVQC